MSEFVEAYLAAVELAMLISIPILAILTLYSWAVAINRRPYRLPLVLALANTVIGACATWLVWTVLYRSRIGLVPTDFLPITATAILLLCTVPFFSTLYLVYLESRDDA